jgi:hypothetical protein
MVALAILTFSLGYFTMSPQNVREYLVWDEPKSYYFDLKTVAEEDLLAAEGKIKKYIRTQNVVDWNALILYTSPSQSDNLLDKKYLLMIENLEEKLQELPDWKNLCKATSVYDETCSLTEAFVSPLVFLSLGGVNDLSTATQEEISRAWSIFFHNKPLYKRFKALYSPRKSIAASGKVTFMRSILNFGAPLNINGERYNDVTDRYND